MKPDNDNGKRFTIAALLNRYPYLETAIHNFNFLRILKISSDILGKLPSSKDPPWQIGIKFLAILSSFQTHLGTASLNRIQSTLSRNKRVVLCKNRVFVDLLAETTLIDQFDIDSFQLEDDFQIDTMKHHSWGTLYLVSYRANGRVVYLQDFWHTPNFDFPQALNFLWKTYRDQISFQLSDPDSHGERNMVIIDIPPIIDPLFGNGRDLLELLLRDRKFFKNHGRTYLLIGPAGTGKTTLVQHLRRSISGRLLTISAKALANVRQKPLYFLVDNLRPDIIAIEDIDRIYFGDALPDVLQIFTDLKIKYPNITVFISANNIGALDEALIRSGRADDILEFVLLGPEKRREFITQYRQEFSPQSPPLNPEKLEEIVKITENFGHADLRDVALKSTVMSHQDLLQRIKTRIHWTEELKSQKAKPKF